MIEDLVRNLKSENQELQMHCASAIFKVRTGLAETQTSQAHKNLTNAWTVLFQTRYKHQNFESLSVSAQKVLLLFLSHCSSR